MATYDTRVRICGKPDILRVRFTNLTSLNLIPRRVLDSFGLKWNSGKKYFCDANLNIVRGVGHFHGQVEFLETGWSDLDADFVVCEYPGTGCSQSCPANCDSTHKWDLTIGSDNIPHKLQVD
jgi:hypothetical protein